MEFKFSVNEVFRQPVVKIGSNLLPPGFTGDRRAFWDTVGKVSEVINAMGESSAAAQGLTKPITTAERLRNSEHNVYLLIDQNAAHGRGAVTGMLKTGKKGLYVFDRNGQHFQVSPPCVLDFYVHESRQRTGLGKRLFEHMLQEESIEPVKMAIDRPSEKFLGFLNKHYSLNNPVKQMNNYVVFDGFFPSTPEKNGAMEINHHSIPGKKQSANGLQTTSYAAPLGRYGAPRPPCSMGQIIHNQTSTLPKNTEPTGLGDTRSLPATNYQYASQSPVYPYITQSMPNMYNEQKVRLDGLRPNQYYPQNIGDHQEKSEILNKEQKLNENQYLVQELNNQNVSLQQNQYPTDTQNMPYNNTHPQYMQPVHTLNTQDMQHKANLSEQTMQHINNVTGQNMQHLNNEQNMAHMSKEPLQHGGSTPTQNTQHLNNVPAPNIPQVNNASHQNMHMISNFPAPNLPQMNNLSMQNMHQINNMPLQNMHQMNSLPMQNMQQINNLPLQNMPQMTYEPIQNIQQVTNVPQQNMQFANNTPVENKQSINNIPPDNIQYRTSTVEHNVQQYTNLPIQNMQQQIHMVHPTQSQKVMFQNTPSIEHNTQNTMGNIVTDEKLLPQNVQSMQGINQAVTKASKKEMQFLEQNAYSQQIPVQSQISAHNVSKNYQYQQNYHNLNNTNQSVINTALETPNNNLIHSEMTQSHPRSNFTVTNQMNLGQHQNQNLMSYNNEVTQNMNVISPKHGQKMNYNNPHSIGEPAMINPKSEAQYQNRNSQDHAIGDHLNKSEINQQQIEQNEQSESQVEEKISTSPKLERPQSLSIQLSEEQTEDKTNDVESEVLPKEPEIEEETIEKLNISENDLTMGKVETSPENKTPSKRTPSHLTEQGFFDLKFYHNKLW